MKKSGKKLEKLISMIHESLKDSPHTIIRSNYKIPNTSGRKREIDVLIESKINDITIKIAIECKEYSKPVSVEKIEAFKGKCDRITDINKKIFVSQNGYQADAINAAKDFGIDLYTIEQINKDTIAEWLPRIAQINVNFSVGQATIHLDCDETIENIKTKDGLFHFYDKRNPVPMDGFIDNILNSDKRSLLGYTLFSSEFQALHDPQRKVNLPFTIKLSGVYIIDENDTIFSVLGIESSVDTWLTQTDIIIDEVNSYVDLDGKVKANNISIPIGNEKANIISSDDKYSIFHTDQNGNTKELETIMTYNPNQKSNQFKELSNEELVKKHEPNMATTINLTISHLKDALHSPQIFDAIIKSAQTELQRGNTVIINEKYIEDGKEISNELFKFTDMLKFTEWVSKTFNI